MNNYASDQGYGETQDGMEWGLNGISLSNKQQSAYVNESGGIIATIIDIFGGFEQFVNNIITSSKISPYYDFYLTRDNPYSSITPRDYSGLEFNKEIATTLRTISDSKAKIDGITLTESPLSAFAYCYHKNKRNSEGVVENQKWFLPAIDEIEDIAMGAYDEFDKVFQGYEYWSCQPSFNRNTISISIRGLIFTSTATGSYYDDDTDRARATKIVFNETTQKYQNISSDVDGNTMKLSGQNNGAYSSSITSSATPTGEQINYHAGNNSRIGEKCRIRAVYRSGTK